MLRSRWMLDLGRLLVFYVSAALFGGNVVLLIQGLRQDGPGSAVTVPALGAVLMTLVSVFVLVGAPRSGGSGERRSESPSDG